MVEGLNAVRRRASVRTSISRIRRFINRRNSIFGGIAALIVVFGLLFASTPSAQGYSISNTNQIITTTGGGGLIGPSVCGTGSYIYGLGGGGNSGSLTEPVAACGNLNSSATSFNAATSTLGGSGWGGPSNTSLTSQYCSSTQALVGVVAHKQANGYVSGWQLICGTLPDGTSRTTSGTVFGWSNAGTSSPSQRETIECPAGMIAVGMVAYVGSIMDRIGFRCGTITGATQATVTVTSTTGTFGSTVSLASSGGSGSGAVTYAVTSAGTAGCSISGTTLSASAAGTCTVTATKAADTNYAAASSSATTVTFSKASQSISFTNPGTKERSATPFAVAPTATSGLTVSIASSTTSVCTTSGLNITMVTTGTCTIVASQSGNGNYDAAADVSNSFTIQDTTAPTVSSVSISSSAGADNTYIAGDSIQVTVNFSEAVTVTGTPTITMVVGATNRSASYSSGSGTTALVFSYTVVSGDNDNNGITVTTNTLALAGGTIRDASSNNATLTHSAIAASLSHLVDTTAPTVTISRSGSGTVISGQTVTVTFTFSESVTGFDSSDIQRCPTGSFGGTFGTASGSGSTYTVVFTPTANLSSGNPSICIGPGAVSDVGGNSYAAWSSILSIPVDTRSPTISAFSSSAADGTYASGSTIAISATTSEAIQSGNTITATLDTGATVTLTAASAGTTLSGTYTVAAGQSSSDLNVSSFTIGTVLDAAGNAMTSTTVPSGASNIAGAKAIVIEAVLPTVTAFSSSTADGTYGIGATVNISATTSEAIQSGNTLTVTLETGATDRTVLLTAASAGTSLTGTYTVQSGDTSSDLTVASFTIGTVADTAGNAMTSTTVPSGASNIAGAKALVIDGVVPTMTVSASPSSVSSGGTSTVTFTASEATSTFALADVSATLGTLSNFTSVSSTSYTATFTAAQSVGGTATITVSSGSFSDSASNASTSAFTGSITVTNTSASSGGRVAALSGATNYIIERFTTAGASTWVAPRGVSAIDLLVVGGGGGGGSRGAGGGGAGGYAETTNYAVTAGSTYNVTVGAGGAGGPSNQMVSGSAGSASSFLLSGSGVTANGGGAGNAHGVSSASGGASGTASGTGAVASNAGGAGRESGFCGSSDWCGGGGGGVGSTGTAAVNTGGNGGSGRTSSITGSSVTYGGGGAGGGGDSSNPSSSPSAGGTGGSGVGGDGGSPTWNASTSTCIPGRGGNGVANTGSGGGGGAYCNYNYSGDPQGGGGNGATGIVVVRYALPSVSTPDLDATDDLGSSSIDNITSATTLTFTGSAPVGSTVQLYVDGVATGSTCTTSSTTGIWTCDTGVLTAGDKVITAVSTTLLADSTVTSTSSGLTVTVDTTAPTVSISASSTSLRSSQTSTLTFTLSEASTNFAVGDITVSGGALSSFTGSGTSYTVTFTPTANTQSGSGSVSVALGTFTDSASNNNTASSATTITYDTQVATVSSLSISSSAGADNTYVASDSIRVTVNFSEAVTVTGTPTISVVVGATTRSATYISGSGTSALVFGYTVASGENDTDGVTVTANSLSLAGGTINDAAGNTSTITHSAVAASTSHKVDSTAPTVTISASSSTLRSGQTSTLTITLSESSTDFAVGDITISGGTLSSFSGSGTSYSVTFTPTSDTQSGSGSVSVASGAFSDAVGNSSSASSTTTITYDTQVPSVVSISASSSSLKSGQTATLTVTLSEASSNFATGDVSVTGGTLSSITASSSTVYTLTFTPTANTQSGSGSVSVASGAFTDAAGNSNSASSTTTITYDTQLPSVSAFSSSTADGTYGIGATVNISATTSEAIQSGNTITATLDTGATVTLTAASAGTSLTGTYTVASGQSTSDLTVSSFTIGAVADTAGNAMTSTTVPSGASNIAGAKAIVIDGVVPTMTVSASPSSVSSGGTSTVTFTSSEATSTFALADVSATLGTLSNFTAVSSTSYTATFTAAQSVGGTATITVSSGSFTDTYSNASTSAFSGTLTVTNTSSSSGGRISALSGGTNYVIERFTTVGSSTWTVPRGVSSIEYLVVGGGGAGGTAYSNASSGGGGGGQVTTGTRSVTANETYTIAVGAGGAVSSASPNPGGDGGRSAITTSGGTTVAAGLGGGGGSSYGVSCASCAGSTSGYTGGGGGVWANALSSGSTGTGGALYKGGNAFGSNTDGFVQAAGGGGGAGGAGSPATSSIGGAGGAGVSSSLTGSSVRYGGGGGGGKRMITGSAGSGTDGGGNGGLNAAGSAGISGRGGGGGGAGGDGSTGGVGGSGIVVVRYALPSVSTPDLDTADDLGPSGTDDITSATTLTFTGSAPVGSTVQLYVDGVASGSTCTADATTGVWSCDTGVLTAGDKVVTAESTTVLADSTVTSTSSGLTVTIETTAPTVSISASSTSLKAGEASTLTFTLSETSANFVVGDITFSGGTLSSFTAVSGTSYTVVFTPTANTQSGTGSVSIASGAFTDTAGNTNTASSTTSLTYNTQVATVSSLSISSSAGADNTYVASDSIRVTVNFSEAVTVTGTPTISVVVGATTRSATYISGSGTSALVFGYTVVSGDNDTDGVTVTANSLSLAGGTINNAASNASTLTQTAVAASTSHKVDTTAPTVTISASSSTLRSGQTSTLTITLSESSTDFAVGDITISGGTLSSFSGSGTSYSVTFTPTANTQSGSGSVSVASGAFSDAAGNSSSASSTTTITYDTQAPSVSSISASSSALRSGQTSTLTITLSESSTDFVVGDITFSGGTLSSFSGSGSSYSVTFTPTANTQSGSGSVSVASGALTDAAGNSNSASSTTTITYDTQLPSVSAFSSSTADGTYGIGATVNISATTSEAIQSGNTLTVTLETGSIDRTVLLTAASAGTSLTGTYTVQSGDTTSDLTVSSFTIGTVSDTAGNAMTSTTVPSGASNIAGAKAIVIDGVVPTMTVSASPSSVSSGGTSTVTFTSSEATSTFALADVSATLGTLSNFTAVSSTSYTATFTAAQSVGGTATITVSSGSFTDAYSNASTSAFTGTLTVTNTSSSSGGRVSALSGATNYIIERFTSVGTSSWTVPRGVTSVEYLVVGGGGGGAGGHGTAHGGGGGGAGGYRTATISGLTAGTTYTVTVGAGGNGGAARNIGATGGNSVFGSVTSLGGGGGGSYFIAPTSGGSGGGAGASTSLITGASGTAGQGFAGGNTPTQDFTTNGAGGGGSGGAGENGVNNGAIAAGGAGTASSISGTSVTRAAGGAGGLGSTSAAGATGSQNSGDGGGGGSAVGGVEGVGGAGGSGIVVVRYALPSVSTPDLDAADDLGPSGTDNITSATTLTFTGSAPVGSTVQLYVDGVASGNTCTANATTGVWSCDTGVLTAGDKVVTAESTTVLADSTVTSTSSGLTVTIETTAPTVSISASSTSLKAGEASTLTFTLSETSANFVVGDITFSGGTLSSFTAVSGTSYTVVFTPTANTQSGTGSVSIASGAFTDTAGNTNTASSTTSLSYDTQLPTVSNVTSSSTNGTFTLGDTVSIQVVFSEAVTVSGTPRLTLETGSTDRAVNYASGSGTTSLTFTYTVQTGDSSSDLDYVSTSSLALNGGSIVDAASNAATLTLPAPGASGSLGANKAIVVTSAPTKVVSVRTPVGTASGAAFTTQPQVSLQDSGNNVVTSDSSTVITASVSAGATLVGTTTATASSGVATFSNLGISGTAGTAYTITYSATYGGNALTVATQSVTPTVGAATQISITTQPVGATAGAALSTQPVVKILDSGNNTVTTASASIDVTASGGTLAGTRTVSTSSGVATFTDLTFAGTANTNYTLTFAATGYTSQTSSSFNVGVGAATKLVLTTSAATAKYGQAFTTQPVVQVQDAGSNVVTASSAVVTASLSSGTVVGTGNATSSSGVATFSGLGITGSPGSYTITYSSGALATASQAITVARADQSALSLTSTSGTYGAALTLTTSGGSGTGATTYVVVDGTATGCTESGGALSVTSAGTCTVTATKALDTNYNAVSSSATTVTFAKANQSSLILTSTSGTYGSTVTLTTSGGTTAGLVSYSVTGTGCSITAGALSKTAAGDCSVTATMAGNGNYESVSSSATTVTFAKANQSVLSVTSISGTYGSSLTLTTSGGTTSGSVTYVVTGTGCSITSGALSKSAAGDCSVTATMAGNGNYEPVSSAATTVTFGQASQSSLTVTSTSGTYGSPLTLATSGGTTGGSVTYVVTGTGCSITSGALSKTSAGDCAVTATMAGNSNYNAVSSSATTVSFARVALTVTADAKSKQYGATDPGLTHTITSGALVGSDSLSGSLSRASGEDVGTYAINQGTLTNSNYDITYTGANLTVTERPITVTADSATKQYGASDPTFTFAITTGSLVGQDALTGSLSRTSGSNVGSYALTIGTLANSNYDITFVPANLSITQRPITVTAAAKSKQYGASDPALTYSVTTGSLVGSDSLSGSLTRVLGDSVGTYAILRGTLDNTNYDITYAGALLSVSQRPITVTAAAKTKEYGAADPQLTYSVTTGSLVGSDTLTGTLSRATGDSVGTYAINQGTLANSNYDITYAGANLTVTQRAITVTADAKSKEYGAMDPALTYAITTGSLVGSDTLSGSLSRTSGESVGTYAIAQGSLANGNYDITYAGANLTVTERPISITADAATKEYGATDPTFTYAITAGSLVGQDALTGSLSRTSGSNVGSYALTIGTLANTNYNITFVPANLTITQRPVTVTAADKTKVFGSTDPSLTYSVTTGSLVGSDSFSGALSRVSGENVGTYAINQGTLANSNYNISFVNGTMSVTRATQSALTVTTSQVTYGTSVVLGSSGGSGTGDVTYAVSSAGTAGCSISSDTLTATGDVGSTCTVTATKAQSTNYNAATSATKTITVIDRAITVTATAVSKTYGDSDPTFAYAITSGALVSGDSLAGTLGRTSGENVGTYAINQGTLSNSNYAITFVSANLTIDARPLTITASNRSKTYGDSDPSLAYTVTSGSLVGSDSLSGSVSRNTGENIGSYVIGQGTLNNPNYAITFNNGSFVINGANQSGFTLSAGSTLVTYQDTTVLSTSGGNGNGAVSYAVTDGTGGCTISGNTLTAVSAGTCVVTATKAQEGNYNEATSNNVTITVARRAQVVTFTKPADRNFSTTAFTLAPSVDSGLTPVLTSQTTNVCTVTGMSVTMVDSGACTLVASSNSTTNFAAATDVTQSFIISAVVPYAPILDSLTASDGAISASFTLGNSGGSALLNHEYSLDNGVTWSPWPNGSITSPLNISNLTNGVEYEVKIRAVNAIGAGAESNMLAVTPLAPVIVVAAPVQTAESTTTVVSSSTTVFVVTTVKRNPAGRGTTTTVARRAVTTTVASRNGQIATTTTTVITTTTTGSTTTTSPATSTTSVERQPAIVERATTTTVKTQTSIFQSFTPTVPAANVPDTIPARLIPAEVASVVAGQSAQVVITQIEKQQVHAAIGESTMMVASVGETGALEPLLANGSVAFTRGSTLRVDGTGMLPGSQVAVWLHSTPTKLGTADVAADGTFAEVLSVPAEIELGGHKVHFIGSTPDGSTMEFALGVTVVDETALIMNKAGAMSATQADSLADANVVSVGTLSSADSAKLMLWFLVILLLVAGLIATKPQRIGVVASRVQRFEMATPWLNGFAVPRLLMVLVGILAGFGAANSTMFDASAPSALWIAIIVAIGVLDVVAGSVAGGIFICSVLASGSVQSISDIRLMAVVALLGFLPSSIARVVRPSAANRSVSLTVSLVMHAVIVVALLNLFTPLTGMQFAVTQSISEIAWIAGLAVIGRELLLKVTHTNEDQRATALPALRLIGVLALSMLVFASPVTSVWTVAAWVVLSVVVVFGLRIRVGLRAPSSQRVFISSIAAGFLLVAISTGAFIPSNQADQITGATSVLPIGDLKVIGELDVLIDGYPRTFVAIKTGEGEVTFINGAVGQSLTIDSFTKDGDRIPLSENNQVQLVRGQSISISANGYAQNEAMNAWLFSDPVLLGNATTNDNGSLKSKFEVPNAPADGPHTLQIRLIDVDGKVVTFAIPIVLMSEVPNGAA